MPKTKLQEVVFTILMVFVMVYAMICYNIALNMGGMSNIVFLNAFHELVIMGPIAFILDFFLYGSLSKKLAFRIVTPGVDKPIMIILAISGIVITIKLKFEGEKGRLVFAIIFLSIFVGCYLIGYLVNASSSVEKRFAQVTK